MPRPRGESGMRQQRRGSETDGGDNINKIIFKNIPGAKRVVIKHGAERNIWHASAFVLHSV